MSGLPNIPTLGLAVTFLVTASLTYRCWTPPNPNPSTTASVLPKDDVGPGGYATGIRRFVPLALWTLHILNTLYYPTPSSKLCPNPINLSSALFVFSSHITTAIMAILIAAPVRIAAFKQLGEDFTFGLARPKELVTTGLYAYAQHPSYLTNWMVLVAKITLLLSLEGVLGCFLPNWIVKWGMGSGGLVYSPFCWQSSDC
jgi:protein-S-isoprenylcysteine O-methyltransferase Ste14